MPPRLSPVRARFLAGLGCAVATGLLTGCGPGPAPPLVPTPPPIVVDPTAHSPQPTLPVPSLPPVNTSTSPGFPEDRAVRCGNRPSAEAVLELLRTEEVLPDGEEATVVDGPLCAGTWQYAVVSVPDREPLQVVTEGEPGQLELVTAGTQVCTVDVRVRAPAGIRLAADC